MKISLTDAAYDYLKDVGTGVPFAELYAAAAEKAALTEELKKKKKNSFYSQLSMDSRFVQQTGNVWDLKENHSFEETRINVEEIDADDDDSDEENEETDEIAEEREDSSDDYDKPQSNDEY